MQNLIAGLCLLVCAFASGMKFSDKDEVEPSVTVRCHGKLRIGVASIGGETTGTTITFHKRTWELNLQDEETIAFVENHNKEPVTAIGTLRKVQGTETKTRWIIDVKTLEERDAKVTAEGTLLTILGTIRSVKTSPHQPAHLTIQAGDISWPITFPMDPKLQAKAETLVGKLVSIHGALELESDTSSHRETIVQVKTLSPVEKSAD
ncbi:MAG: hypothetical protein U0929_15085 [Planctomycetaceae bacterium]